MCSGNSVLTASFPFKKGDKVRVVRKVATHFDGWKNSWTGEMDKAVGKTGVVTHVIEKDKDVTVDIPGITLYGYPSFGLELVVDKPVQTTTVVTEKLPSLTVGQRVLVKMHPTSGWNGEGVLEKIASPENYIVKFDRYGFFDRGGFEPKYLTAVPSTPVAAPFSPTAVPPTGLHAYAGSLSRKAEALVIARNFAVESAKANVNRRVTIDNIQHELEKRGFKSTDLGNSAGVVFKGGQFRDTGLTVKSNRPGNRGRRVIIWEYSDSTASAPVPVKQFVVEVSFNNGLTWTRSGNNAADGRRLDKITLDYETATREAALQRTKSSFPYQVTPVS